MQRVLLLLDHPANRRILADRLGTDDSIVLVEPVGEAAPDPPPALRDVDSRVAAAGLAGSFDLCVLDGPSLSRVREAVVLRKEAELPGFLPFLLLTPHRDVGMMTGNLWQAVDDVLIAPIEGAELRARMQSLLRARRLSLELRGMARQVEARNRFIQQVFGRYLSDEVVENLLGTQGGLTLGGESRVVTVLMADLRGFSVVAEALPPDRVLALLNNYLGRMAEIVGQHQGTVDEFIGDAVLALFGAPIQRPDDARRALACALEMQLAMEEVNATNRSAGLPTVELGVGINTGEVVVGNIGSEQRSKYGVVGHHVNLASRIEACSVGGQVLVSSSTLAAAGDDVRVDATFDIFPKGSASPVRIHEISGLGGEDGIALRARRAELHALAMPVDVQIGLLTGSNVLGRGRTGTITHLSAQEAVIRSPVPLDPLETIRLELPAASGSAEPRLVYGRVMSAEDEGATLCVRFTSIAPAAAPLIDDLLAAARKADGK